MSDDWNLAVSDHYGEFEAAWHNLRTFYDEWFSTLAVSVTTQADWHELLDELGAYGLSYEVRDETRAADERYALFDSISPPGAAAMQERQVIFVRRMHEG
ncbi:hypothetical protein N5I87_20795 [Ralstonia sp. CHL-2022]|uniref:Uncharacterized protein n=1 Tax=Ralstonia mojiangensis TaxID=2953895 RepID=A0AAE3I6N8_9RALS|nr:hypothetical protein [Ralstonia mojiangensis]MCT7318465.1 hypothetical protein [Ralstonia mojiangensis]MCT7326777.1 hypothetical protein [Ralstonia mojiangensis]